MLEFIRRIYRGFVLISFFILLILFPVCGGIIGKAASDYRNNYTVIGVIVGLIVGFVLDILIHGFIATILNIDENLESQNNLLKDIKRTASTTMQTMQPEKKCNKCGKISQGYSSCPHCGASFI